MKKYGAKIKLGLLALGLMLSNVAVSAELKIKTPDVSYATREMEKKFEQEFAKGQSSTIVNGFGFNPLMHAARYGKVEFLKSMLENQYFKKKFLKDVYNFEKISRGVRMRNITLIKAPGDTLYLGFRKGKYFNDAKKKLGKLFFEGMTVLHFAVLGGNVEGVKMLMAAGADPDKKNAKGLTPINLTEKLEAAKRLYILMILKKITTLKGDREALFAALQSGDINFVKRVLELGAEMDVQDKNGKTPLMYSLEQYGQGKKKFEPIIDFLRGRGALIKVGYKYYALSPK